MNFLQICQRTARESGLSSSVGSTVGQSGESQLIVDWCQQAWHDIQQAADWVWLQSDFSFTTSADQWAYLPTEIGLTRFKRWMPGTFRIYKTSSGQGTEQYLMGEDWPLFRDTYRFGAMASQTGYPSHFSIRPEDQAIVLGAVPDAQYTVSGRYLKSPETISGNSTVPTGMPEEFHMLIVWRALIEYGGYDAAAEVVARARGNYRSMYMKMAEQSLPQISLGGALA